MNLALACAMASAIAGLPPGFGDHTRAVTTASPEAQARFDEGLAYLSAFNHDEAIRAFTDATVADPTCAMCFFGVAMAYGPNINFAQLPPDRAQAAHEAISRASALSAAGSAAASPVEVALIAAQRARYSWPAPAGRAHLDKAYADAMRDVVRRFGEDNDVVAWCAEALLALRPWDQWRRDGKAQPGTEEVLALLDRVLARDPTHPLANHLLIHALEASPFPERADAAADRLRTLAPALGHLLHMPSHIDVRRGRYAAAIAANESALRVDDAYVAAHPDTGLYRTYVMHNRHMLAFAAMMSGKSALALSRVRELDKTIPAEWIEHSPLELDGTLALRFEVLVRFGRWDELLKEPEPRSTLPFSRAMWRYGRGIALAAQGDVNAARVEQKAFDAARAAVPKDQVFGANPTAKLLAIAKAMLAGEVLLAEGKLPLAIARLEDAVRAEDALKYDEPPDWILPARHPLGVALLKAGRIADAERVYRADLARWPDNVWSLWGLTTALAARGAPDPALVARFEQARAGADVPLTTSCFCIPGI